MKKQTIALFIALLTCSIVNAQNKNLVLNYTEHGNFDDIVNTGLDLLGIEGVTVSVHSEDSFLASDFLVNTKSYGYMSKSTQIDSVYSIFINTQKDERYFIVTLAHEILHVNQYHTGQLYNKTEWHVYFRGVPYDMRSVRYADRPWENEAYLLQGALALAIKRSMLKNKINL